MPNPRDDTPPSLREALFALPRIHRVLWFGLGALVAVAATVLVFAHPFARRAHAEPALPYELFPFADNSGVCQEYVALASQLRVSHSAARDTVSALLATLPAGVRAENLRVVRAFAPGDVWTVAIDTQPGAGDMAHAAEAAGAMNAVPGATVRFEPVFYGTRRLYDTARVLCMPRSTGDPVTDGRTR